MVLSRSTLLLIVLALSMHLSSNSLPHTSKNSKTLLQDFVYKNRPFENKVVHEKDLSKRKSVKKHRFIRSWRKYRIENSSRRLVHEMIRRGVTGRRHCVELCALYCTVVCHRI